jgi:lysophospholipase L1-like esterase
LDVVVSHLRSEESQVLLALGMESASPGAIIQPVVPIDTTAVAQAPLPADTTLAAVPEAIDHPLAPFVAALTRLKASGKKVRIGYFGDSMIEGDLITQSLRNDLQERFGGTGVGFVPITSQTYGFRKTIRHRFSGDWQDFNLLAPQAPAHEYGISGEYFLTQRPDAAGSTWVRYQGEDLYPSTQTFERVRLFYGRRKSESAPASHQVVMVSTDQGEDTLALDRHDLVNEVLICSQPTSEVKLNFQIPKDLPVYGLSFESAEGIFIDNFASRGNSGMNLVEIPGTTLAQFHQHLDYDLIVLQFGLNVISTRRTDFSSYERGMKRVIEHFQKHTPGTAILLVSCSDKSTRVKGRLQTDPSVPLVVAAQQRVAAETGVAFLDLYEAMGGHNAMIQWVKDDLARSDYTHPNRKGAERVGNIVRDFLLAGVQQEKDSVSQKAFAWH